MHVRHSVHAWGGMGVDDNWQPELSSKAVPSYGAGGTAPRPVSQALVTVDAHCLSLELIIFEYSTVS